MTSHPSVSLLDRFSDLVDNVKDPYLMLDNAMINLPIRSGALLLLVVLAAARYYHVTVSGKKRSLSLGQIKALEKQIVKTPSQLENEEMEMATIDMTFGPMKSS